MRTCSTQVKNTKEYGKTLNQAVKRLTGYLPDIQNVFQVGKHNVGNKALSYIKGIWPSSLTNLERISETGFPDDYFGLQHFISDSPWDAWELMDHVSKQVSSNMPNQKLIGLHIDESGNRKKGKHSIGVAPQYCGNLGKVDNSQIAVFAALSQGDFASIIDSKLYLPKSWTEDKTRLDKAKVPAENRAFKTKQELALDIIKHQMSLDTKFDYIGGDAYYGADQKLTDAIDQMAIAFLMDVRENQHIFLEKPEIQVPKRKSNRGRKPSKLKADKTSISVSEYQKTLSRDDFKELKVRNTAKGKLKCLYHFKTVYIWDKESHHASKRLLVLRKSIKKRKVEISYALGNVDLAQYTPEAIAYMQAQRFFIEHTFKEAKSVLGMHQFQTRKWIAWYHQIALNMLLLLFIFREKLLNFKNFPLLLAWDIRQLMQVQLICEMNDPDKILELILKRHLIRQKDINRCYSNN
ncbi:MAG: IS701 family transposase [Bacteroidetes bacterium]|nr:IS701 family transposase [Bacteroidota bacterium]